MKRTQTTLLQIKPFLTLKCDIGIVIVGTVDTHTTASSIIHVINIKTIQYLQSTNSFVESFASIRSSPGNAKEP